MELTTSRFGTVVVKESEIISFPEGIIGFSEFKRYVIITHDDDSLFHWLQCVDNPELAFVVIDPLLICPDYTIDVREEEINILNIKDLKEAKALVIVVIPANDATKIRANLRGPILLNTKNNIAQQLVLSDEYPLRYLIASNIPDKVTDKSA